eukprot:jgi/Bigna1/76376/fgenesh1_pg.40_\
MRRSILSYHGKNEMIRARTIHRFLNRTPIIPLLCFSCVLLIIGVGGGDGASLKTKSKRSFVAALLSPKEQPAPAKSYLGHGLRRRFNTYDHHGPNFEFTTDSHHHHHYRHPNHGQLLNAISPETKADFRRFRGGTSNTVTEDSEDAIPEDEDEEPPKVFDGKVIPEEYVGEDDPDSDEDAEATKDREAKRLKEEETENQDKQKDGLFYNFTSNPDQEQAIVYAALFLHQEKQNVTAEKIFDICKAATHGRVEVPSGRLIPGLGVGCGAANQGRIGVHDEPGSAVGAGAGATGAGEKTEAKGKAKPEEKEKEEEQDEEDEEEAEFDLFD